ncbi:hypothetical protein OS175_02890 [Marinicella sp. S1101]|uniref:hypothetical protein n=1 Tax=Marinicella marina TaxID=2996016 RepID=UPI0022608CF7|nr:hypothetical protein [Marinicella marina]MCX7552814.1 hypothetical protein [Marinicella marina]MDJ1139877.1 hypothetical protein [Marinicella marina]
MIETTNNLTQRTSYFKSVCLVLLLVSAATALAGAELVAADLISTSQGEHSPTFDATRNELVFMRRTPGQFNYTLYTSKLIDGAWTDPKVLPFSGTYRDGGASFSPDGGTLLFDSKRPVVGLPKNSINLWQVKRLQQGWGKPEPLAVLSANEPSESVAGRDEFGPIMTRSGEVLFYSFRQPNRAGSHYRGRPGEKPTAQIDFPDPSQATFVGYLTLSADGRTAVIEGRSQTGRDTDLYYACQTNGQWSEAEPLTAANSAAGDGTPYLSSDNQWLYFASDRIEAKGPSGEPNIYRINTRTLPIPCE